MKWILDNFLLFWVYAISLIIGVSLIAHLIGLDRNKISVPLQQPGPCCVNLVP